MNTGLLTAQKLAVWQAESRTLIDMSLSVRSLDLDFATGTFKLSGWMKLAWRDDRQLTPPPPRQRFQRRPLALLENTTTLHGGRGGVISFNIA